MDLHYSRIFQEIFNPEVYLQTTAPQKLVLPIIEEAYRLDLSWTPHDPATVAFRLETIKEQARYLKNGKRSGGKDCDGTILDEAIYQIEVKKSNTDRNFSATKQFAGGERWLRHLLALVVARDAQLKVQVEVPVYNLLIRIARPSLSRSRGTRGWTGKRQTAQPILKNMDTYFRLVVPQRTQALDITRYKALIRESDVNRRIFRIA